MPHLNLPTPCRVAWTTDHSPFWTGTTPFLHVPDGALRAAYLLRGAPFHAGDLPHLAAPSYRLFRTLLLPPHTTPLVAVHHRTDAGRRRFAAFAPYTCHLRHHRMARHPRQLLPFAWFPPAPRPTYLPLPAAFKHAPAFSTPRLGGGAPYFVRIPPLYPLVHYCATFAGNAPAPSVLRFTFGTAYPPPRTGSAHLRCDAPHTMALACCYVCLGYASCLWWMAALTLTYRPTPLLPLILYAYLFRGSSAALPGSATLPTHFRFIACPFTRIGNALNMYAMFSAHWFACCDRAPNTVSLAPTTHRYAYLNMPFPAAPGDRRAVFIHLPSGAPPLHVFI